MKKTLYLFFYLIAIVTVVSCKKDDTEPASNPGVMEKFLNDNPSIKVSEAKDSYVSSLNTDFGVYRGYYIMPSKDIKIKALGCKVAEKGTYELIIASGAFYDLMMGNYIYSDNIDIKNEDVFQFKEVNQEIILLANHRYLLVYFRKNPTSYLEARYVTNNGANDANPIKIPLMINDIQVTETSYNYADYGSDGNLYFLGTGGGLLGGAFHLYGLVDFKYELAE